MLVVHADTASTCHKQSRNRFISLFLSNLYIGVRMRDEKKNYLFPAAGGKKKSGGERDLNVEGGMLLLCCPIFVKAQHNVIESGEVRGGA